MISHQNEKIRACSIFFIIMILFLVVAVRLVMLQVVGGDFFTLLADKQYMTTLTLKPPRAHIYDRNGINLVENKKQYSLCIFPRSLHEPQNTHAFLEEHFPHVLERLHADPRSAFMYVHRKLSSQQKEIVESSGISDLHILEEAGRYYPVPCCGIVVGMTNIDGDGASGLELQCDAQLQGKPGSCSVLRDARNAKQCYFQTITHEAPRDGTPIVTTLDSVLQFLVYDELKKTVDSFGASEGAAIVMDTDTGDILAMTCYPDFDPNNSLHLVVDHTRNRAVSDTYEFGSVIKVFLALAALAEGVVTPETVINCYNTKEMSLHGVKLSTWKPHGEITFSEVIEGSNNIGTAQVAFLLESALYTHYRNCGFGSSTNTLIGEQQGHVTHPSTWCQQSLASLSYGYEIRATLLQLICAWNIIASGGLWVQPRLMKSSNQNVPRRLYSEPLIQQIQEILERTVEKGTARNASIKGYRVLGKTGSARLCVNGAYQKDRSIYTFVGTVHRRTIATFIKEPKGHNLYASNVAAPLFNRIAERILVYDGAI